MRNHVLVVVLALAGCAAAGCADANNLYTTKGSRQQANQLAAEVARYADEQRHRIDRLNEDYRLTYERLCDELVRVGNDELRQTFFDDAMRQGDAFIDGLAVETLPGHFRDSLEQRVAAQRAKIDEVDASIATARNAYAESYQSVALELARLKKVQKQLDALGTDEKQLKNIRELVNKVYSAYRKVKKRDDEEAQKGDPSAGAGTGGGPA